MGQIESRLSELDKVEEPKSSTKSTWICRNLGTPRKKQKSLNYMYRRSSSGQWHRPVLQ